MASVVKFNTFAIYWATGCALPYTTTYLEEYAGASESHVGLTLFITSILTIPCSLIICSTADRLRAHRLAFLLILFVGTLSWLSLLIPMHLPTNYLDNPIWLYLLSGLVMIGVITNTVSISFTQAFCTGVANRLDVTYGSMRLWGSVGYIGSSLVLIKINTITWMPFLEPALLMLGLFMVMDILLLAFWRDPSPFDLGHKTGNSGVEFSFESCLGLGSTTTLNSTFSDLQSSNVLFNKTVQQQVSLTSASSMPENLTGRSEIDRVRSCSLAPLGNSHYITHFELQSSNNCKQRPLSEPTTGKPAESPTREDTPPFFNHVTRIESRQELQARLQTVEVRRRLSQELANQINSNSRLRHLLQPSSYLDDDHLSSKTDDEHSKLSYWKHLRILSIIIQNDRKIPRFMTAYFINGFVISLNWWYLNPYIRHLNPVAFPYLSAMVMTGSYLGEACFYRYSHVVTKRLTNSQGLTLCLFIYVLRYLLYVVISSQNWPIELFVLVEFFLTPNISYHEAIMNESALEFAGKVRDCLPKLLERGLVESNDPVKTDQLVNAFGITMLSVSSACFDGFGVGFGSLIGGLLIELAGHESIWFLGAGLGLVFGLINLSFDLREPKDLETNQRRGNRLEILSNN